MSTNIKKPKVSIAVTTYSTQSFYTQECLSSIAKWKSHNHELLVACHDASLLLEYYLKGCLADGLIDQIIWTPHNFGHTMGVNKCLENASGDILCNIANDIIIGPYIVDSCSWRLTNNKQIGLIGWHWYGKGTIWGENGRVIKYDLRDNQKPELSDIDKQNIENASWFTGKFFKGLGPYWLQLCNTAFFCIRKDVWKRIGGFDTVYRHYWADDFLNYAILYQGLDIIPFDSRFKNKHYFYEFQYSNTTIQNRNRDLDSVPLPDHIKQWTQDLNGGMNNRECELLYQIARSIQPKSTILNIGLWKGCSLGLCLMANQNKEMHFIGIDCFDLPEISKMSNQPPVSVQEVLSYIEPIMDTKHSLELIKNNTLNMKEFPKADLIFVDGGHTKECITNDIQLAKHAIKPNGVLVFHDYGEKSWPEVKIAIDSEFGNKVRFY